ncbi:putative vacuolar carboxypeptidase protein [Eutypa lata UCREL1]|uniref:Putative vacuolar carboxypeptidase protein n=1 Tax=Eutypa lata (strain UCR-EL1) TaxID=1287681 RepID=M7TPN1_EUTLA|nr:putative vacuolar carboxypeptidase protein [Eutypa lata UCREL1]
MSPEQLQLQIDRLTAAVQVPTESFDDNGDANEDPRWETFEDFHKVLSELFPLVHSNLELPHQDVVPAGDSSLWKYPPFSAHYDGSFIWGRGAADCKNVLIGVLSVIEDLLSQSFAPQRTVVLAFGFDEETGGLRGAASLNISLVEEWGSDSFLFVLDEGGMGVQTLGDVLYAYPGVGEKGYHDVQVVLQVKGGHSSRPPVHTGIGIMADAILALENEPYLPRLTQSNPFRRVLECNAKHSPDAVPEWLSDALLNDGEEEIADKLANVMLDERWLMQTSQAVDVITGGHKVNALPEEVQIQTLDLAPISPTDGGVWTVFSGTLRYVFESTEAGQGKTVIPAGNIMTGNTDTVHYWNLTKNIYRFTPARDGTRLNQHAVDERMGMTAHLEGMRLYYGKFRYWSKTH